MWACYLGFVDRGSCGAEHEAATQHAMLEHFVVGIGLLRCLCAARGLHGDVQFCLQSLPFRGYAACMTEEEGSRGKAFELNAKHSTVFFHVIPCFSSSMEEWGV